MKSIILILGLSIMGLSANAQKTVKTYYDYLQTKPHKSYTVNAAGEPHGTYKEYDSDGIVVKEFNYVNGQKHGQCLEYSTFQGGGKRWLWKKENYKEGILSGAAIYYNADGVITVQGNYVNGKREGEWTVIQMFGNSKLPDNCRYFKASKSYVAGEEVKPTVGRHLIYYYPSGKTYKETNYADGKLNGQYREYTCSGHIVLEENYKQGQLDGKWVLYSQSDSGKVLTSGQYTQGKKTGPWKYYFDKDWHETIVESEFAYFRTISYDATGKPSGPVGDHYLDGTKQFEGSLVSENPDKLNGRCLFYYSNGQLQSERNYENGIKTGNSKEYHENGKIKTEQTFANGLPNGPYKGYDDKGNLTIEGIAVNGKKDGKWIGYYPSGAKSDEEYYELGDLDSGVYYNEDGTLKSAFDGMDNISGSRLLERLIIQMLKFIQAGNIGKGTFSFQPNAYNHPTNDIEQLFYELVDLTDAKDPITKHKAQLSEARSKYNQGDLKQSINLLEAIIK